MIIFSFSLIYRWIIWFIEIFSIFFERCLTYRCHGDKGPPICFHHIEHFCVIVVFFKNVSQRREYQYTHCKEEHEEAKLFITVTKCKSKTLQAHWMTCKLKNSKVKEHGGKKIYVILDTYENDRFLMISRQFRDICLHTWVFAWFGRIERFVELL